MDMRKNTICFQLLLAGILFCSQQSYSFGVNGVNGVDGARGNDGVKQEVKDIVLSDDVNTILFPGKNGAEGDDGTSGSDAKDCQQPVRSNTSLLGALGGLAGLGGNGGHGADGTHVRIIAESTERLKTVRVDISGGKGATGGIAGLPGKGCDCTERSWVGSDGINYSCFNGSKGGRATDGKPGVNGKMGQLTVFLNGEGLDPYEIVPDKTYAAVDLDQIPNDPIALFRNHFDNKGSSRVFAQGSRIPETYRLWNRLTNIILTVRLNKDKESDFWVGKRIGVELNAADQIEITNPDGLVPDYEVTQQGTEFLLIVQDILDPASDLLPADQFAVSNFSAERNLPQEFWLIQKDHTLRYIKGTSAPVVIEGAVNEITIGKDLNDIWAVDAESQQILKFKDGGWEVFTGDKAKNLSRGPDRLWTTDTRNNIWYRDFERNRWNSLRAGSKDISVSTSGQLWSVGPGGKVWERVSGRWENRGLSARKIAAGNGDAWALDESGAIQQWQQSSGQWQKGPNLPGKVLNIQSNRDGELYLTILPKGSPDESFLYKWDGSSLRPLLP